MPNHFITSEGLLLLIYVGRFTEYVPKSVRCGEPDRGSVQDALGTNFANMQIHEGASESRLRQVFFVSVSKQVRGLLMFLFLPRLLKNPQVTN